MDLKKISPPNEFSRRQFLEFFGGTSLVLMGLNVLPGLTSCSQLSTSDVGPRSIPSLSPTAEDKVVLAEGLQESLLIKWGDPINLAGDTFGFNNDFTALVPLDDNNALLWVNHEYINPLFVSQSKAGESKKKFQVEKEMYDCGGSILKISRVGTSSIWKVDIQDSRNKRMTAHTPFPLIGPQGETVAMTYGTLGNCAGGLTPWKTILTCEENYELFVGDKDFVTGKILPGLFEWEKFFSYPPEHYGWVVEIDPSTGEGKKLMSLGRFGHESATVIKAPDGRIVVYSGDDRENECLYKFISSQPDSLDEGELFVANLEEGRWISLDREKNPKLKTTFKDQKELLTHCRVASKIVKGTPLDRPEDIKIHPHTQAVFVSLTNNIPAGNYFGKILKLEEEGKDPCSLKFKKSFFAIGGEHEGFACPDNLCFDKRGNLWMSTDISGKLMNKAPYMKFKNNGLFYFPLTGDQSGKAFQLASAPVEAEFTGMSFSSDHKTLFLSVQHPGENSPSLTELTSHWPEGGNKIPRPGLIQITGPTMESFFA